MPDAKLYRLVQEAYLQYETLDVKKMTVTFSDAKTNLKLTGNLRVLKDSIIWMSLRKGPIEVMRLKLTPQEVCFIDRYNKEYLESDYEYFNQKFGLDLDFNIIQSVLTNTLLEYSNEKDRPFFRNFKGKVRDDKYLFFAKGNHRPTDKLTKYEPVQEITIDSERFRVEKIHIFDLLKDVVFNMNYQDYKMFDNQLFPETIKMDVRHQDNLFDTTIKIQKMELNEKLEFPFEISSKYDKIND